MSALRGRLGRRFTLIELLIVVGIISVLASLLLMGLRGAGRKAQTKATKALVEQLKVALDTYFGDFRDYPPDGYDLEPGWNVTADGVMVGEPPRRVKGTGSLIYFLCRPIVKLTFVGNASDPRNAVRKTVGPYLILQPGNFSREAFDPGMTWDNTDWGDTCNPTTGANIAAPAGSKQLRKAEIVDVFGRGLHYDKVRAYNPTTAATAPNGFLYFQPDRFQGFVGATSTGGKGFLVHHDQTYMSDLTAATCTDDNEIICPTTHDSGLSGVAAADRIRIHTDPRWRTTPTLPDGCAASSYAASGSPSGGTFPGTVTSHAPRFVGGYDIWSHGESYVNPRDDITSWE